jgi:hypothetical protein
VGVAKLDLPAGLSLIACPFNAVGGNALSIDEVFGQSLPDSTLVYVWVPSDSVGSFITYEKVEGSWYDDNGDPRGSDPILRGEGFWVYTSVAVSNVTLAGEVPAAAAGTNRVELVPGMQIVSFGFPQQMTFGDSGLNPTQGDVINKWINGQFVTLEFNDGAWYDQFGDPVDLQFNPTEGFWYNSFSSTTNTWDQKKTYIWP